MGEGAALDRIAAALAFLPTPADVSALAIIANTSEQVVLDLVADLNPGLRLIDGSLTISDEDFEDHIAQRSAQMRDATVGRIAEYFWQEYTRSAFAAAMWSTTSFGLDDNRTSSR